MTDTSPFEGSMDERLQKAEEIIGLEFDDKALLQQALTHPSASKRKHDSNALLGTLGQEMIRLHVSQRIYEKTEQVNSDIERLLGANEGSLSLLAQYVTSSHVLGEVSEEIGLSPLLIRANESMRMDVRMKADVFRSTIAAIFLRHGTEKVQPKLDEWLVEPVLNEDLLNMNRRSKGKLILIATSVFGQDKFDFHNEPDGETSSTACRISIYFGDRFISIGEGSNSHVAKQNAINNAFDTLNFWHPGYKSKETK